MSINKMLVHFNIDKAYCFKEFENGLYYLDISDPEIVPITAKDTVTEYSFFIYCRCKHVVFNPKKILKE